MIDKKDVKMKQTNVITMETKDDLILKVMGDMKRTVGVQTNHENQVNLTIQALIKEGKLTAEVPKAKKETVAMKLIAEQFILYKVGIPKEDWEEMVIEKLHSGTRKDKSGNKNQIIYCRFKDTRDATNIRLKMADKPQEISNQLVNYVHDAAYQRWRIYDNIAYQYRQ